jgi:hypothetical protein
MNIEQDIVDLIRQRGRATADDLAPLLPEYRRTQILMAIGRCVQKKKLESLGHRRVLGRKNGSLPSFYRLTELEAAKASVLPSAPRAPVPPASVWDLAVPRVEADWPPPFEGGRAFQLLTDDI